MPRDHAVTTTELASTKSKAREYVEAIVVALLLAFFIRTFVVQAFKIPSGSMIPTLQVGDHILVSKFIYGLRNPFSGEVLVPLKEPKTFDVIVFKYPKNPKLDFIKRVIGTPGDTVEVRDKQIFLNGAPLRDPYGIHRDPRIFDRRQSPRDNFGPITVPPGKLFVMGDNRDESNDSRFWGFVDMKAVKGKAFLIYWSWDVNQPLLVPPKRFTTVRWSRIGDLIH